MSTIDHLTEQQILRHEAHLKHIDELLDRAQTTSDAETDTDQLLRAIRSERDDLARVLQKMQGEPPENWQESAEAQFGPLAPWNMIARLLENLIERLEGNRKQD